MNGEAEVKYLDGDFRVVRPGAYVRCAITGVPIPIEELKYWSVDRQEAYVSPEAVLQRLKPSARQRSAPAARGGFRPHSRTASAPAARARAAPGPGAPDRRS